MHELDAIADLSHEDDAISFRQLKILGNNAFKEFATANAANKAKQDKALGLEG